MLWQRSSWGGLSRPWPLPFLSQAQTLFMEVLSESTTRNNQAQIPLDGREECGQMEPKRSTNIHYETASIDGCLLSGWIHPLPYLFYRLLLYLDRCPLGLGLSASFSRSKDITVPSEENNKSKSPIYMLWRLTLNLHMLLPVRTMGIRSGMEIAVQQTFLI